MRPWGREPGSPPCPLDVGCYSGDGSLGCGSASAGSTHPGHRNRTRRSRPRPRKGLAGGATCLLAKVHGGRRPLNVAGAAKRGPTGHCGRRVEGKEGRPAGALRQRGPTFLQRRRRPRGHVLVSGLGGASEGRSEARCVRVVRGGPHPRGRGLGQQPRAVRRGGARLAAPPRAPSPLCAVPSGEYRLTALGCAMGRRCRGVQGELYSEKIEKRSCNVASLSWHPTHLLLGIGWEDGTTTAGGPPPAPSCADPCPARPQGCCNSGTSSLAPSARTGRCTAEPCASWNGVPTGRSSSAPTLCAAGPQTRAPTPAPHPDSPPRTWTCATCRRGALVCGAPTSAAGSCTSYSSASWVPSPRWSLRA